MPDQTEKKNRAHGSSHQSILYRTDWKAETSKVSSQSGDGHSQSIDTKAEDRRPTEDSISEDNLKSSIERRQYLEHHLRSRPTDLESYLELAQLYRDGDRPADAKRVLEQAAEVFPKQTQILWELEEAVLARSLQQYREVLEIAERLDTPEIDRELERSENDWASRRIEVCEARIARDPDLHDLRLALGEALLDAGRFKESIQAIAPLQDHDFFSASAYFLKGRCFLEIGQNHEAMKAFRSVALRRAVPAPAPLKIAALQLLCSTADRLGLPCTLELYQTQLKITESEVHGKSDEKQTLK